MIRIEFQSRGPNGTKVERIWPAVPRLGDWVTLFDTSHESDEIEVEGTVVEVEWFDASYAAEPIVRIEVE